MRSPKRVSLLLRISRVGFPQTTTCVVVARVASKYLRMSYAGPVSLVLIVCWSCLKLSITDWNSDAMIMDFETNCYHSPLTLENAKENTFLESTFKIENNKFRFWIKNDNTLEQPNKIW